MPRLRFSLHLWSQNNYAKILTIVLKKNKNISRFLFIKSMYLVFKKKALSLYPYVF